MDQSSDQDEIRSRLQKVLDRLFERGTNQQAIAESMGVPGQYLSDIKMGRKRVAELFARRMAECYDFDYRWLMTGEGNPPQFLSQGGRTPLPAPGPVRLPLFDHPISGNPQALPEWTGAFVELAGAAAAQARAAEEPYILRFRKHDTEGRLREDDLVLVSQAVKEDAEIQVIRYRQQCFLARRTADGRSFQRVATGQALGQGAVPVGHALGIIWAIL
jgi:hypothetical protein